MDSTTIVATMIDNTAMDSTTIDNTVIDPTTIDPTMVDPTTIDNTGIGTTTIDLPTTKEPGNTTGCLFLRQMCENTSTGMCFGSMKTQRCQT